jgi:hypothetical protein
VHGPLTPALPERTVFATDAVIYFPNDASPVKKAIQLRMLFVELSTRSIAHLAEQVASETHRRAENIGPITVQQLIARCKELGLKLDLFSRAV